MNNCVCPAAILTYLRIELSFPRDRAQRLYRNKLLLYVWNAKPYIRSFV